MPWRNDATYFKKAKISLKSVLSMLVHSNYGVDLVSRSLQCEQVVGFGLGKILDETFVINSIAEMPAEAGPAHVNFDKFMFIENFD